MPAGVEFGDLNWLGLGIAVVLNIVVGFVWYAPKMPTGKIWMRVNGFDPSHKPTPGQMAQGMILMVVGAFLIMFVMAHDQIAYRDAYTLDCLQSGGELDGCDGEEWKLTWMDGAMGGFFTWLGFFVPVLWAAQGWEMKPWSLFFVNAGYYLVTLVAAGIVLATVGT